MGPAFPTVAPTGCARAAPRRRPASAPIATAAQYQKDMERVQQYIRERVQLEDETYLLGVNDARSRQCYAEIQSFLVRKLQLEQARAAGATAPQQSARMATPAAGDRVLLRDLDEYLDELDPALFSAATTPASGRHGAAIDVPAGASYIRRMQEDAKAAAAAGLRPCQSSENLAMHATPRAGGAFKRMRSL